MNTLSVKDLMKMMYPSPENEFQNGWNSAINEILEAVGEKPKRAPVKVDKSKTFRERLSELHSRCKGLVDLKLASAHDKT